MPFCRTGFGYDLGISYYPRNEDGDYLFHKGFVYLAKKWLTFNHQLQFEYGLKDYTEAKALDGTITTYQSKERLDRRLSGEYSIGKALTKKLYTRFRSKFSTNDSNARFLTFYDYDTWRQSVGLEYKLTPKIALSSDFAYTKKEYDSRTVIGRPYVQEDDLYAGSVGISYALNSKVSLLLSYIYRNNSSNEPLEEYSENVITCGWQYMF